MPLNTTANIPYRNSFLDRTLLERALPNLVHDRFAMIKDLPLNNSNIIKFRKYAALEPNTTALTAGVTPEGKLAVVTDISTTVRQYGDYMIADDFTLDTSEDPVLIEFAEVLGEQAGQSLDLIIREVLHAGTNVRYADVTAPKTNDERGEVVAADVLSAGEIRLAIWTLKMQNAKRITQMVSADRGYATTPVAAAYVGIVHPTTGLNLKSVVGFEPIEKYAAQTNPLPGEIGKFEEVRFIETTFGKVFEGEGGGDIDVYSTLFLGMNAYGVSRLSGRAMENIVKAVGSAGANDPLNQRGTTGWKATMGVTRLQEFFMLRVEHANA